MLKRECHSQAVPCEIMEGCGAPPYSYAVPAPQLMRYRWRISRGTPLDTQARTLGNGKRARLAISSAIGSDSHAVLIREAEDLFFYRRVFVCALRSAEDLLMRLNCEYTEIGRAFLRAERSAEVRGMRVGPRAASRGAHPLPKNVHLCF